jgi:hypothetical protein
VDAFDRAMAARARRIQRRDTAHHHPQRIYLLSGLLVCEGCGLHYRARYDQ